MNNEHLATDQSDQVLYHKMTESEEQAVTTLVNNADLSPTIRNAIGERAKAMIHAIRTDSSPDVMELFLEEYSLSTDEGIALMCLAEALLRVPDEQTIDALIEDKIAPSQWSQHLGQSNSPLVNASTWALMLTGSILKEDDSPRLASVLRGAIKRLGEPVIRTAVTQAMREMGKQFVLGRTIDEALKRGENDTQRGYSYSFDMLGEAARTEEDARQYYLAYSEAISGLAKFSDHDDFRKNPGISVKLSALHPRYEPTQKAALMDELLPRLRSLALLAKSAAMGFNIDAEEAHMLELSLDMIEKTLDDPALAGWDGFGVVVQAYDKRAPLVIDALYALAKRLDRNIMIRLVKGAYWDSEIKRSQVLGLSYYPVFTRKASTDISYISCASKLLSLNDRIYPQFATHNAHTVAAVLELADETHSFEFQRLHGMGIALHNQLVDQGIRSRIYAPVGNHRDLLAYLVRRLLENGANSSFVNQIVNEEISVDEIARDPFAFAEQHQGHIANPNIHSPLDLYAPERRNSAGLDIMERHDRALMDALRHPWLDAQWTASPLIAGKYQGGGTLKITNPAQPDDVVGEVVESSVDDIAIALEAATPWDASREQRARILNKVSELYEANAGEIYAILAREAGKNPLDAIAEIREAVDFLRYYAAEQLKTDLPPAGAYVCISPWNFPLAIFTGQIAAALAAGNSVIAKPAEQTPLIAYRAVQIFHEAGVPTNALQLCPGDGPGIGAPLVSDPRINGVCFTGGTDTAQHINRAMAKSVDPAAPLIAETGGLNAMIVDSTALLEQAVTDIVASAFQSAGQRCSALRILYVQQDIADDLLEMLYGAMDALSVGNPWEFSTDVGPVIDQAAQQHILAYIEQAKSENRLLKMINAPETGLFVPPCVVAVDNISAMEEEIFGPVLHVATFAADAIEQVIEEINQAAYGLTFGLHTRIDERVQQVIDRVHVGNLYINRNQIGAIVGSQPFGGEGLSGTGPKAGGPHYLSRFYRHEMPAAKAIENASPVSFNKAQSALDKLAPPRAEQINMSSMPGPTGELNQLGLYPKGRVLCLGPSAEDAATQAVIAQNVGCSALQIAAGSEGESHLNGVLDAGFLSQLEHFEAVVYWGDTETKRALRRALAARSGAILPLITEKDFSNRLYLERHVCIDTTASGGNATLLAESSDEAA